MHSAEKEPQQVPAIEGWFTWPPSSKPHLLGSRCPSCGDYFFPRVQVCANPTCMNADVEDVELSRRGSLYTYAINYYPAPPPYVPADPFRPYATAVMELEEERMLILGQIASGYDLDKLTVGMELEVVLETLHESPDGDDVIVWKFRPS